MYRVIEINSELTYEQQDLGMGERWWDSTINSELTISGGRSQGDGAGEMISTDGVNGTATVRCPKSTGHEIYKKVAETKSHKSRAIKARGIK